METQYIEVLLFDLIHTFLSTRAKRSFTHTQDTLFSPKEKVYVPSSSTPDESSTASTPDLCEVGSTWFNSKGVGLFVTGCCSLGADGGADCPFATCNFKEQK